MTRACRCGCPLPPWWPHDFCTDCGQPPPPARRIGVPIRVPIADSPPPPQLLMPHAPQPLIPRAHWPSAPPPQPICPCLIAGAMIPPPPSQPPPLLSRHTPPPPPSPSRPPPALRWDPYIIATDVAYPHEQHVQTKTRREVLMGAGVIKLLRWNVSIFQHLDTELDRLHNITNISLVVCLHPWCRYDAEGKRIRNLAAEENLDHVTFLIQNIARNWQRAHILWYKPAAQTWTGTTWQALDFKFMMLGLHGQ